MVIDTSAVLAILLAEPDAERYADAIDRAGVRRMSAANYLEAAVVVDRRGDVVASRELDRFFGRSGIVIEPVTFEQARIARHAGKDFGLNFGDCLAYALAKSVDEPLLFKGADFSRTDVEAAV